MEALVWEILHSSFHTVCAKAPCAALLHTERIFCISCAFRGHSPNSKKYSSPQVGNNGGIGNRLSFIFLDNVCSIHTCNLAFRRRIYLIQSHNLSLGKQGVHLKQICFSTYHSQNCQVPWHTQEGTHVPSSHSHERSLLSTLTPCSKSVFLAHVEWFQDGAENYLTLPASCILLEVYAHSWAVLSVPV